ncbi:peptidase S8/S53 domain-containing protein [Syncephalis plumigaleata]|nr:peptidase S8/S53 domain-containing protein [Syncephalis plumigaleata]
MRTLKFIVSVALLLQAEHVSPTNVYNPWRYVSYNAGDGGFSGYKLTFTKDGPIYQSLFSGKYIKPYTLHDITGVELVHSLANLDGSGIKMGIIDSGLDYQHEAFTPNLELHPLTSKYNVDFVGKNYNGLNVPYPTNAAPVDCKGSGTNMAGLVISNTSMFKGIAPNTTLAIYRVFGCQGTTKSSVVLNALEQAIKDNMDIIVLPSIVYTRKNHLKMKNMIKIAADKNIIVVAPAGDNRNIDIQGTDMVSLAGAELISVGAAEIPYHMSQWFWLGNDISAPITYQSYCFFKNIELGEVEVEIVNAVPNGDKCMIRNNVKNKIALLMAKGCKPSTVMEAAARKGAIGVIIAVEVNEQVKPLSSCPIPVIAITHEDARKIVKQLWIEPRTRLNFFGDAGFTNEIGKMRINVNTLASDYSKLDVDILAPGYHLFTTYLSQTKQMYGYYSGASAATAYLAGTLALLLQLYPRKSLNVVVIKALLQSSAYPIASHLSDALDPVMHQGAGMVNVFNMVQLNTIVSPTVIPLLNRLKLNSNVIYGHSERISITNNSKQERVYCIYSRGAATIPANPNAQTHANGGVNANQYKHHYASVEFHPNVVTIKPNKEVIIQATFVEPSGLPINEDWSYSGYIIIDPQATCSLVPSTKAVQIPYFGIKRAQQTA